jgi:hypothetical protein
VVAACVVGDADQLTPTDRALLGDLGVGTVLLAAPDGTPRPA